MAKVSNQRAVYRCYDCNTPYAASFEEMLAADNAETPLECPWCDEGGNDPADTESPNSTWDAYIDYKYPDVKD